jgi:hypothetical protein
MGITNAALAEVSGLVGNTGSKTAFTYLANGSGDTAFAASQTALVTENTANGSARAAATVSQTTTTQTNDTLKLLKQWTATGAVTIKEAGSFNAASAGTMLHRKVLDSTVTLANTDTYTYTVSIAFA